MSNARLFADAAEKQTVEQSQPGAELSVVEQTSRYDERTAQPVVSDEYKRLSNKLSSVTLVKARARGYTSQQLRDECKFIDEHRLSMSAAMLSLNKLMRKVFEEELKARETAESLGVRRREGVPMTHRMRLLYHGERY